MFYSTVPLSVAFVGISGRTSSEVKRQRVSHVPCRLPIRPTVGHLDMSRPSTFKEKRFLGQPDLMLDAADQRLAKDGDSSAHGL
jgi:hypothetical protein